MKRVIAGVVAALLGGAAGVVIWTALAVIGLVAYWGGFVLLYCGIVCGQPGGKRLGLGWCDPPANLEDINDAVTLCTAIAFTWGEIIAALLGALIGIAAALGLIRLYSLAAYVFRRKASQ